MTGATARHANDCIRDNRLGLLKHLQLAAITQVAKKRSQFSHYFAFYLLQTIVFSEGSID